MVYLSKIYTKTGDRGETSLGDGSRVPKDHLRVAAYGSVDELNAVLGLARIHAEDAQLSEIVREIQNDLFDIGADLCVPVSENAPDNCLRLKREQVTRLEKTIDRFNADLQPLKSFVLPGGTLLASWCHLARTVCRRAERELVGLCRTEPINQQILIYLNRLSDLLFVLARVCNDNGKQDVLWIPGKTAENKE